MPKLLVGKPLVLMLLLAGSGRALKRAQNLKVVDCFLRDDLDQPLVRNRKKQTYG